MDPELVLILAVIDTLGRQTEINERFADQLAVIANSALSSIADEDVREALMSMARQQRISAMESRARIEVLSHEVVQRSCVARREPES